MIPADATTRSPRARPGAAGVGLVAPLFPGDVLSEAHAAFWGPGVAEIGAVTAHDARGRGLAPVVVARLVHECAARGAETVWSCDRANAASARVARKLGYSRERAYRLLEYLRPPAR